MSAFIQPGYKFFSPEFRENDFNLYRLSIGLALDGFSFLVQNQKQDILVLYSAAFNDAVTWDDVIPGLENIFKQFPWLNQPMEKKLALMESPKFTLIPFSFYENKEKRKYLELNHPLNEEEAIQNDMLKEFYSYVIYARDNKLQQMIRQNISNLSWHHYVTDFVKCTAKYNADKYIAADIRNSRVYISAFSDKRLMFCNEFRYNTKEDFVYYIVLAYRNLGYDPKTIPLKVTGLIDYDSEIISLMKRYIANIDFDDTAKIFFDTDHQEDVCQYQFETLKQAAFCE
ncbi:MAG: DUF3822 family protein [Bacteroidales bacterium]|nr:DUF3822 family protein [Bacteroidales bacterium]MCF8327374.1 DUF3822 family protein [Bacteroidales bacterium]